MRLSYDRAEDILTIETAPTGIIDHAEQTGPFIAHFDPAGQLVLLKVLDASDFLASLVKVTARGTVEELPAGG